MSKISKTGDNGHFIYELEVTEKSYSVKKNTSTVSITFKMLYNNYSTYWYGWGSKMKYTVTINGTSYTGNIPDRYESNKTADVTLINGTQQTITHNNNGAKKINISFSVVDTTGAYYACGNASNSGTLTLTTIPRASSFKINNKTENVVVNVEDSVEITITRSSSDFSHKIQCYAPDDLKNNSGTKEYSAGWITIKTLNKDTVKYNYTIHPAWYNLFGNKKAETDDKTGNPLLKFRVLTYSGSSHVGTSSEQKIALTLNPSKTTPTISRCTIDYPGKDYYWGDTSDGKKVLDPITKTVKGTYTYIYPANYKKYRIYKNNGADADLSNKTVKDHSFSISSDTIKFDFDDAFGIKRTYSIKNTEAVFYSKPSLKISDLVYTYEEESEGKYRIKGCKYTVTGSAFGYNDNSTITISSVLSENSNDTPVEQSEKIYIGKEGLNKNINQTYSLGDIIIDSVSTSFYLITSYKDNKTDSGELSKKTYKIQPLFDWNSEDFQFNIPVIFPENAAYDLSTKKGGSLNMNNGDIIKANRIVFADYAQSNASEGMVFPRSSGNNYDCLRVYNGELRILPNYDGGGTYPTEQIYYPYKPYYSAGDSIKFSNNYVQWIGHLTDGSKELHFTIPLDKPVEAKKATITGHLECRGTSGYLYMGSSGYINLSASGLTISSAYFTATGVHFVIEHSSYYQTSSGAQYPNNHPLSIEPLGDKDISAAGITLTFSD